MNKPKIYIGIDPDTEASGVALWDSHEKNYDYITTMSFWELISELKQWIIPIHIYIEAGWLISKSNWHDKPGQTKTIGEKIAKAVGSNHQIGKLIMEYCKIKNIPYTLTLPQGKFNAKTFKSITKWQKPTNQDMRDAAMLVYGI